MSTICQVYSLYAGELWLGRRDEGGMRSVAIDVSPWLADLVSGGTFMLAVSRPGEDTSPYNPVIEFDGAKIIWAPDDVDTAIAGTGTAELRYYVGTNKIKSKAFKTIIAAAPFTMLTPPSAIEPFVERIEQAAANATAASASASISAATATEQADTAATKASEASTSASQADASADAAATSATSAAGSATAAGQSATAAANAAEDAAESEQIAAAAANAATAASGTATTKAAEAAQSATTAANQATAAAQSATAASASAGDAEQAAETATSKATEASTSATQADASADAASASATSAAGSATAAGQSATAAANAQTAATNAKDAAEQAASSVTASAEQIETNKQDISTIKADFLQSRIYDTASGPVATFPDGAHNLPCKSVVAQIVPVQSGSGDPSPDNVRPISGWDAVNVAKCGKNLIDKSTAYFASSYAVFGGTASVIDGSLILHPGTYVLSVSEQMTGLYASTMSGNFATRYNATSLTFTLAEKTTVRLLLYKSGATKADMEGYNYQLELGSTATAYEPYTGSTYPVTLPQTVYGGQAVYKGDGTWDINVTHGFSTLDSQWSWLKSTSFPGGFYSDKAQSLGYKLNTPFICSHAKTASTQDEYVAGTCYCDGSLNFRLMSASDTVLDWRAYIEAQRTNGTPIQICYKLATPQTVTVTTEQLITTLYGSNTVYADSGDVAVEYPADTKLYISRLTEPDSADMIADANIISGKYFMVGNDLYLATANIANGGAITPGTNCTKVSLATALNAINS